MKSTTFRGANRWLVAGVIGAAGMFGASLAAQTAKVQTVATLPSKGPIENLCETEDGSIYLTALTDHTIFKVTPDGKVSTLAILPVVAVVGITPLNDGFLVTAFTKPYQRPAPAADGGSGAPRMVIDMSDVGPQVLRLDKSGNITERIEGEKGAAFNAIAPAGGGAYLITDTNGAVWRLDLAAKKIALWLKEPELMPTNKALPFGADGLKVRNGSAYIATVSGNAIYRVRIGADGRPAGKLETFAKGFQVDDFDLARDGSLYPTWSSDTTLRKVSATGEVSVPVEGIHGGAATMVSRDGRWLYWPTHGGATASQLLRTPLQ